MKTTLWTREDVEKARELLASLQEGVKEAMAEFDAAVAEVSKRQAAFDAAEAPEAKPLWIELVRAMDDLERATKGFERVVKEVAALNGRLEYAERGEVRLSGTDEEGYLVEWSSTPDGKAESAPVDSLEPRPSPESATTNANANTKN